MKHLFHGLCLHEMFDLSMDIASSRWRKLRSASKSSLACVMEAITCNSPGILRNGSGKSRSPGSVASRLGGAAGSKTDLISMMTASAHSDVDG